MCQNCIHARASIAGTMFRYHIDMMSVMGYTVLEGACSEYITEKYPHINDEERNRIITDVVAAQGRVWTHELNKDLGNLLGAHVAQSVRECVRSIGTDGRENLADNEDLDELMEARQTMEQILQDSNVQSVIDNLTDDGEEEES